MTQRTSLAPGLLLAAPRLGDPNFERSVVLLGQHDEEGALGWVLNGRALSPVGELLREAELVPDGVVLPEREAYLTAARIGGPVSPGSAWLLYRLGEGEELPDPVADAAPTLPVGGRSAVSSSRELIEAVARGEGPPAFRLLLGYAGWGPMQLESEIQQGAWLPVSVELDLLVDPLFGLEPEALWDAAYRVAVGASPMAFNSPEKGSA